MQLNSNLHRYGALLPLLLVFAAACGQSATETAESEAVASVEEIPISASDEAMELIEEGLYLSDVGRGVAAHDKFMAAIETDPSSVAAHLNRAVNALSFQEFQQALDAADAAENGNDGERKRVEVLRSFLTNDTQQGVNSAEELVAMYPNSPRALVVLAGMQSGNNDNEAARANYEKALDLDPNFAAALFGIANNYLFTEPKDFAKAEEWAQKAINAYPTEAKGHEVMGDIKRAQNDLDAALASYNKVSELDPTLELGHHKRGHVNSFLGNIDDARTAYSQAIDIAPVETKANYAVFRAFTRIHEGDHDAAIQELVGIANGLDEYGTPKGQAKGVRVFALNSAAQVALHSGKMRRAERLIERRNKIAMAIAEDVGTEDAERLQKVGCHQWDGLLAAYSGDADAAAAAAAEMETLVADDDNPRKMEGAHYVLGMAALESGDYAAAVGHLRQADYRNNMYVRYNLALAEEGAGNGEEAARMFDEIGRFNFNSVGFALVGRDAAARAAAVEEAA